MESSSCISPEFYVIVRHVVYCIDVIISLLKCTYTKCLYMQKETNIPGSNSVKTNKVAGDKMFRFRSRYSETDFDVDNKTRKEVFKILKK